MTEEEKKPEAAEAEAPKEKPAAVPEAPKEAAPQEQEAVGKKKRKMNKLSVKDLESELKSVKEKMGNLKSRYAKQLLKQKDILGGAK